MVSLESKKEDLVTTGMRTEKKAITWKITDFDLVRTSSVLIGKQQINLEVGGTIGFKLDFNCFLWERSKMEGGQEKKWIGVYMKIITQLLGFQGNNCCAFRMKIPRANGSYFMIAETPVQNIYSSSLGFPWVVRKDAKLEDFPLVDGSLILELEIVLYVAWNVANLPKSNLAELPEIEEKFKAQFVSKLQADLGRLLSSSSQYPDLKSKLVTKDNVEFAIHRGLIMVRCPVLGKLLELTKSELKTCGRETVYKSELSSKTMSVLMRFIYTGTLHENWSSADGIVELVYATGVYKVDGLLPLFDQVLGKIATKQTGGKLLNLAKMLSLKKAEKEIFEKMKKEMSTLEEMAAFLKDSGSKDISFI